MPKLDKEQADELAKQYGGRKIIFMKCQCAICETETGALLTDRNIRFYLKHVKATVICKTCSEEMQRAVMLCDMPYVVLHREEEEDEKGHHVN